MAFNPFVGRTKVQLEADLAAAQADLAAGKQVSRVTVPGIDVTNAMELTITDRIKFILRALNKLDPVNYPASDTSQASVTRISFGTVSTTQQ